MKENRFEEIKTMLDAESSITTGTVGLFCVEALTLLNTLPDDSADVVFLDPPFNLGKAYGDSSPGRDMLEEDEYFKYMAKVLGRASEVVSDGGALYLYHLPQWAIRFGDLLDASLDFRHWIAIALKNGFARGNKLYPAHYALLYYTKGTPKTFTRPKIAPDTCRHCGKYVKDYGGYKEFVEDGINLSDVWTDISPVRHPANKHRDGNELPPKIVSRIATISALEGGLFVDPFMGAGSGIIEMEKRGMYSIGGDREREMLDVVAGRLESIGSTSSEETHG